MTNQVEDWKIYSLAIEPEDIAPEAVLWFDEDYSVHDFVKELENLGIFAKVSGDELSQEIYALANAKGRLENEIEFFENLEKLICQDLHFYVYNSDTRFAVYSYDDITDFKDEVTSRGEDWADHINAGQEAASPAQASSPAPAYNPISSPSLLHEALKKVVAYGLETERKHYEESGKPENHIFNYFRTLEPLAKGQTQSPNYETLLHAVKAYVTAVKDYEDVTDETEELIRLVDLAASPKISPPLFLAKIEIDVDGYEYWEHKLIEAVDIEDALAVAEALALWDYGGENDDRGAAEVDRVDLIPAYAQQAFKALFFASYGWADIPLEVVQAYREGNTDWVSELEDEDPLSGLDVKTADEADES